MIVCYSRRITLRMIVCYYNRRKHYITQKMFVCRYISSMCLPLSYVAREQGQPSEGQRRLKCHTTYGGSNLPRKLIRNMAKINHFVRGSLRQIYGFWKPRHDVEMTARRKCSRNEEREDPQNPGHRRIWFEEHQGLQFDQVPESYVNWGLNRSFDFETSHNV